MLRALPGSQRALVTGFFSLGFAGGEEGARSPRGRDVCFAGACRISPAGDSGIPLGCNLVRHIEPSVARNKLVEKAREGETFP